MHACHSAERRNLSRLLDAFATPFLNCLSMLAITYIHRKLGRAFALVLSTYCLPPVLFLLLRSVPVRLGSMEYWR